jgi:hypothetical protein
MVNKYEAWTWIGLSVTMTFIAAGMGSVPLTLLCGAIGLVWVYVALKYHKTG